jgi:crotonobetainyl-CoA:carnitine CoA-transferase CaiB-like acyl-CoA transferase
MPGALSGLRVLDLSRVLAGPWAAQVFGDLGADVIKIERPGIGDESRAWGPPYLKDQAGNDTTEAAYFLSANRNKKSVCVDFTRPEGQQIIRQLAVKCDILLENFKVDGLKQYGLDYESLKQINPRLIYCSITGFGQSGPYAPRAGYDFLIQGMGGLMSITGHKDGEPGAGPQKVGVALTDVLTGLYSVISVLAALNHRHLTNEGQHVDLALLDVQVTSLANQNMNFLTSEKPPVRMGNAHPNIVPYQDFPTADGAMIIAVGNDEQFAALCKVLGHPKWATDERFTTNTLRVKNRETIIGLLSGVTATRPTADWVKACEGVGVPCGPINNLKAVFDDPHIKARKLRFDMPHPTAGTMPMVGSPIRMSATPVEYRSPPPLLGEHTLAVLEEILGLSRDEIGALHGSKIVQARRLS